MVHIQFGRNYIFIHGYQKQCLENKVEPVLFLLKSLYSKSVLLNFHLFACSHVQDPKDH